MSLPNNLASQGGLAPTLASLGLALCTLACSASPDPEQTEGATQSEAAEASADSSSASEESSSSSEEGGGPELPFPAEAGPDTTVTAFDATHVYWLGWDEGQNFRDVDVSVDFPDTSLGYTGVQLELTLGCPNNLCDWWDRKGFIGVVENAGSEDEHVIEIGRIMTPYRVGGTWTMDVSDLRPLLSGTQTLRVHIDTWVGPGHANGDGWLVDADFQFTGGLAAEMPVQVLPVYPEFGFDVGDPNLPVEDLVAPTSLALPAGASRVELRTLISGHGQGNSENCAEFCAKQHGMLINGAPFSTEIWRDDCGENPINNQAGNWQPSRAGWCPGDLVGVWREDVSAAAILDGDNEVAYALQDYVNSCRPDSPSCTGCVLGTGCDWDGGNHTPPHYRMSSALVVYAAE